MLMFRSVSRSPNPHGLISTVITFPPCSITSLVSFLHVFPIFFHVFSDSPDKPEENIRLIFRKPMQRNRIGVRMLPHDERIYFEALLRRKKHFDFPVVL